MGSMNLLKQQPAPQNDKRPVTAIRQRNKTNLSAVTPRLIMHRSSPVTRRRMTEKKLSTSGYPRHGAAPPIFAERR